MDGRKVLSLLVLSAFLFSILPFVSSVSNLEAGNVTVYVDGLNNNKTLGGNGGSLNTFINVSVDEFYVTQNWTGYAVWLYSNGLTANTTRVLVNNTQATLTNKSGTNLLETNFTIQINTTIFEDGNDYVLIVELRNGTGTVPLNVTTTAVQIDNTQPDASAGFTPTSTVTNGSLNFTITLNESETTNCYLNFSGTNPGKKGYTGVHAGNSASVSFLASSLNVAEQTYRYTWLCTDEKDSSTSALQTLIVDLPTSAGKTAFIVDQGVGKVTGKNTLTIGSGNGNSPLDIFSKFINWLKSLFS